MWHFKWQKTQLNKDIASPNLYLQADSFADPEAINVSLRQSNASPGSASSESTYSNDSVGSLLHVYNNTVLDQHENTYCAGIAEYCEERRRLWWTLYIWDRQLGLVFNRPAMLTDAECEEVQIPMCDESWQASGTPASPRTASSYGIPKNSDHRSVFGSFVPLMSILGQLIDMHHLKNHPALQLQSFITTGISQAVREQLTALSGPSETLADISTMRGTSAFDAPGHDEETSRLEGHRDQPESIQICYAKFQRHALSALALVEWDLSLLREQYNSAEPSSICDSATQSVIASGKSLEQIFEVDPEFDFKPMFFGIFLFFCSAITCASVSRQRGSSNPELVQTVGTYIRALEASVSVKHCEHLVSFYAQSCL